MELNDWKRPTWLRPGRLRPATAEEITAIGVTWLRLAPSASTGRVLLVVDDLVAASLQSAVWANKTDYHFRNVNYGRDYEADIVTDLVAVAEGHACPSCGAPLRWCAASRWATFKLGTKFQ
ncbi:MAG: hypothetical protein R2838_03575 [Caldilineaceae bacterium]